MLFLKLLINQYTLACTYHSCKHNKWHWCYLSMLYMFFDLLHVHVPVYSLMAMMSPVYVDFLWDLIWWIWWDLISLWLFIRIENMGFLFIIQIDGNDEKNQNPQQKTGEIFFCQSIIYLSPLISVAEKNKSNICPSLF